MDPSDIPPRTILISLFWLFGFRGGGGGQSQILTINIVRIVMHIDIMDGALAMYNVCPTDNIFAYNCVIHIVTMYTEFVLYCADYVE